MMYKRRSRRLLSRDTQRYILWTDPQTFRLSLLELCLRQPWCILLKLKTYADLLFVQFVPNIIQISTTQVPNICSEHVTNVQLNP